MVMELKMQTFPIFEVEMLKVAFKITFLSSTLFFITHNIPPVLFYSSYYNIPSIVCKVYCNNCEYNREYMINITTRYLLPLHGIPHYYKRRMSHETG